MIGLGAAALWELWQRINQLDQAVHLKRANAPERKRQSGGGRKQEAEVLCRLLVTLLYLRQHWTMQALAEAIGCQGKRIKILGSIGSRVREDKFDLLSLLCNEAQT